MTGDLNMGGNKVTNFKLGTQNSDAVDFELFNKHVLAGSRDHNNNFTCNTTTI